MKQIFLILALVVTSFTFSQTETVIDPYSDAVKTCLIGNGTRAYYDNVVDDMFKMIQEQYTSQNVPETVWEELKGGKSETLDELSQMVVSAYRGHFTLQDVNNMNTLYQTQAGKRMYTQPSALTETDKFEINTFYQSETGQKIITSQESVNKIMTQVSEMWSSDLYKSVIDKLSEKGYNL
jgi:hypothetical protein